jgi:hypothetical protein
MNGLGVALVRLVLVEELTACGNLKVGGAVVTTVIVAVILRCGMAISTIVMGVGFRKGWAMVVIIVEVVQATQGLSNCTNWWRGIRRCGGCFSGNGLMSYCLWRREQVQEEGWLLFRDSR